VVQNTPLLVAILYHIAWRYQALLAAYSRRPMA
jgi:hypothetical protein